MIQNLGAEALRTEAITCSTRFGGSQLVQDSVPDRPGPTVPPPRPSSSTSDNAAPKGISSIIDTLNLAVALVKNPVGFVTANKDTPATVRSIMINYVAILAAIPFIATLIGNLWYYGLSSRYLFSGYFVGYAFVSAILVYILNIAGVFVTSIAIQRLASYFSSSTDQIKALKLATYIYTPAFLISILNIIPFVSVITVLGVLYGLYILYVGLPIMLGTPQDKVLTYVIATVIVTLVVYGVVSGIVGAVSAAFFFTRLGF